MSRVIALCFLLLAAVVGFIRIYGHPVWAPFLIEQVESIAPEATAVEAQPSSGHHHTSKGKPAAHPPVPSIVAQWLPDTGAPSVHAASLITLKDGAVRAFWFAGSREGASDVVINTAVFDPKSHLWAAPTEVMNRIDAEQGLSRYIAKLGNPVPARLADGRLQLFFVTVSIGGWAGSSISTVISDDEGLTWSRPQRLITSPFFNLSTLVKTPVLPFADGRLGLPAYHEWVGRFGEFLRIDGTRVIDKRRMSSGRSAIQPAVFVDTPQDAIAYFRQMRSSDLPKQIPVSVTQNAGQTWQVAADLPIPNPNSAIAGLRLQDGVQILVLNNIEVGRHRLVMMMRKPSGQWHIVQTLENEEALPDQERKEFSYPYLVTTNGQDAHLVYTWDRKKLRHIYFSKAWLTQAVNLLPDDVSRIHHQDSAESKEAK